MLRCLDNGYISSISFLCVGKKKKKKLVYTTTCCFHGDVSGGSLLQPVHEGRLRAGVTDPGHLGRCEPSSYAASSDPPGAFSGPSQPAGTVQRGRARSSLLDSVYRWGGLIRFCCTSKANIYVCSGTCAGAPGNLLLAPITIWPQ